MIIPVGHEINGVRRNPWVTYSIIALCFLIHFFVSHSLNRTERKVKSLAKDIMVLMMKNPNLTFSKEFEEQFGLDSGAGEELRESSDSQDLTSPFTEDEIADQQKKIDQLSSEFLSVIKSIPYLKWGLIPAKKTFKGFIGHMFLHGGWIHLIGNMFLLFLCGAFIEDVWGRIMFSSFYLLGGIVSGLLFSWHYAQHMGPLIGASGAVSAVMGAFLIRHWKVKVKFIYWFGFFLAGRFSAPAWVMLPLWVFYEYINASMMDSMKQYQGGGVAHWAHIWGFLFGVLIALLLKYTGFERRYVNPKIERETRYVNSDYQEYEKAHQLAFSGNKQEAFDILIAAVKKNSSCHDTNDFLWELAHIIGKQNEAKPYYIRYIESLVRNKEIEKAEFNYFQLKNTFPESTINIQARVELMAYLTEKGDEQDAATLAEELFTEITPSSPVGLIIAFSDACLKLGPDIRRKLLPLIADHPEIPEIKKEEFLQSLNSIPENVTNTAQQELVEKKISNPKTKIDDPIPIPTIDTGSITITPDIHFFSQEKNDLLNVIPVKPLNLLEKSLSAEVVHEGRKNFLYTFIKSISICKIKSELQQSQIIIDLFLDNPIEKISKIRLLRISSKSFNPLQFFPDAASPGKAMHLFVAHLYKMSGATTFPINHSETEKIRVFASVEEYDEFLEDAITAAAHFSDALEFNF
jgi:membrane associated rhomboid family serine protease